MLTADINLDDGLETSVFQNERATDTDVFKNMNCIRS
jgi:hypothetical protein